MVVKLSLQKTIKCSRCRVLKTVPFSWQYKECVKCHERTNRKRLKGKIPTEKLEQKAISQLINFENAWKRHKRFMRKFGTKGMTKDQFRKDFFEHQQIKISQIKAVIDKYNDKRAPILNYDCLRFRFLLSQRNQHLDPTDFIMKPKDHTFFYFHIANCEMCSKYYSIHKYDVPELANLGDKEVSQTEFNEALNQFFEFFREN